ncbi:hypothetical protein AAHC03_01952 [Spirometra sp. Aus1]
MSGTRLALRCSTADVRLPDTRELGTVDFAAAVYSLVRFMLPPRPLLTHPHRPRRPSTMIVSFHTHNNSRINWLPPLQRRPRVALLGD